MSVSNDPLIVIVLVNYNGYKDTIECIESIKNNDYLNYKLVVVDNNSTDNSQKKLLEHSVVNNYQLILSKINGGFSYGNNLGINYAKSINADAVLLLNNDTIVSNSFLRLLVKRYVETNGDGVYTGTILTYKEKDIVWYAGGGLSRISAVTEHFYYNKNYNETEINDKIVTFISGCEMLIPVNIINNIGCLSEDYFLYAEDVDYCARLLYNKIPLYFCGSSIIYHKVSASTTPNSKLSQYYSVRNRNILIKNNCLYFRKFSAYFISNMQFIYRIIKGKLSVKCFIFGSIDYYKGIKGICKRKL